ncbi:energy transducer TonB [Iodidimonas muriae]|uniref:energy transducer TonB n=1 Tax=Iodidimonas muriae TaxID=261467 RepID=UPI001230F42E|nr:TonB family protein [Iodidimonas muriae]
MRPSFKGLILGLTAGVVMAAGATGANAADATSWKRSIAKVVAQKQVYPRSALRREIEGSARVKVTIDRDGKIANFEMLEDTGHEVLNREVPKLMERINPLPTPPSDLSDAELTFILPLSWVLR